MSQFSTNENVSLEKKIEIENFNKISNLAELYEKFELKKCIAWIKENKLSKVQNSKLSQIT